MRSGHVQPPACVARGRLLERRVESTFSACSGARLCLLPLTPHSRSHYRRQVQPDRFYQSPKRSNAVLPGWSGLSATTKGRASTRRLEEIAPTKKPTPTSHARTFSLHDLSSTFNCARLTLPFDLLSPSLSLSLSEPFAEPSASKVLSFPGTAQSINRPLRFHHPSSSAGGPQAERTTHRGHVAARREDHR